MERVLGGAGAGLLSPVQPPCSLFPELSLVFLCWASERDLCREHLGLFMTSVRVYSEYSRNVPHIPPTAQVRGLQFACVKSGFHPLAVCRFCTWQVWLTCSDLEASRMTFPGPSSGGIPLLLFGLSCFYSEVSGCCQGSFWRLSLTLKPITLRRAAQPFAPYTDLSSLSLSLFKGILQPSSRLKTELGP